MPISARAKAADEAFSWVKTFYFDSRYAKRRLEPGISDFTFGNPHEMPLPAFVSAIQEQTVPRGKDWFAYKTSEPEPSAFLARHVGNELDLAFEPADIALTAGAFGAIMVALHLALDAGDEAIFSEPAWFCYEPMLRAIDAVPRKVALKGPTFDLDLDAIERQIGPRTRLVIVNTPHNPTGRIYSSRTLKELADLLDRASARIGHRIFLLSDEPYRRLRFEDRSFVSPARIYPWTFVSYSYGKVLLTPGQRLGYLAVSPLMPLAERKLLRAATVSLQMALGWCFPNAIMQYAVPDLETLSIDLAALTRRRQRILETLVGAGYDPLPPEGTFYVWSRWPRGCDARRLWHALADRDVFVLPGDAMGSPDYFRISLTASDAMVERALPAFAAAVDEVAGREPEMALD
jgi:aspartate aminotransferase